MRFLSIGLGLVCACSFLSASVQAQHLGPRIVHFTGTPGFALEGTYTESGDSVEVFLSGLVLPSELPFAELRLRTAQGTLGQDWSWGRRESDWVQVVADDSIRLTIPGSYHYIREPGVRMEWLVVEARAEGWEALAHAHIRFTLQRSDRPLEVPQGEIEFLRRVLTHFLHNDFRFAKVENPAIAMELQPALNLEGWSQCHPCPDSDLDQPMVLFSDFRSLAGDTLEIATFRARPASMGRFDLMIGYRDAADSLVVRPRYRMIVDGVSGVTAGGEPSYCCPPG